MKRNGLALLAFALALVNVMAEGRPALSMPGLQLRPSADARASTDTPIRAVGLEAGAPGGQWALFSDESYGFTIRYPRNWQLATPVTNLGQGPSIIERRRLFMGPDNAGVNIDLFPNQEGLGLDQWFDRYQARYLLPGEPVQKGLQIAGEPAVYSAESYGGPMPTRHTVLLMHGASVFRIEYQANDGGKSLPIYRRMLRSLAFSRGVPPNDRLFDIPHTNRVRQPVGVQDQECCGFLDPHYNPYGCYNGNCVWWGRYKRPDTGGQGYPYWGNAQYWTSRAAEEGFTVNGTPATGALAGTPRSGYIRPGWEHHVAYVESFDGDTVSFSDMDYGDFDCSIDRWNQPAWNGIEFIHQEGDCPQSGGVILYWNSSYDCQNQDGDPGYRQRTAPGWVDATGAFDDKASSLRVDPGWSVRLYELSSRGGASVCRNSNDSDMAGDFFDGGLVGLDDQVSSYEVFDNSNCDPGPQRPATLFEGSDYGGYWCALTAEGWADVCPGFNDLASSIQIQPGWSCRVYKHIDRGGSSLCLTADDSSFSDNTFEDGTSLDNQVSSFEAFENTTCTPPCSPPLPPSLGEPPNGAVRYPEDNTVLSWSGDAGEYRAHLWGGPGDVYYSGWLTSTSLYTGTLSESPEAYGWNVQGRNSTDCEGPWSSPWEFRIAPRASTMLAATSVSCTQIDLSWQDNSTTESDFHIQRSTDAWNWSEIAAGSVTSYSDAGLTAETTYYYRVRAHRHSDDAYSKYSDVAGATTQGGLAPQPSLLLPTNGSGQCDITPTFDWSTVPGAESYRIQVDDDDGYTSPEIDATTSDSEYAPEAPLAAATYYWRVRATNYCGDGAWSSSWTYVLQTTPVAPTLLSPGNGSQKCDTTPVFDWSSMTGATAYRLQVSDDSSFVAPVIKVTTTNSDYTSRTALAADTYYWRVRAGNICGQGEWSTVWYFDLSGRCVFVYLPTLLRVR